MLAFVNARKISYWPVPLPQFFIASMLLILSQTAFTEETTDGSYDAAIEVVEQLHTVLLSVMQAADSMAFSERYSILDPVITESFDTPVIAKVILSRYWKDLTPQQQEDFIQLFNQQTVATYASRFDSFNDDVFRTISVKQLKKSRILVRTEIRSNGDDPVKLDYLMHKNNEQWLIISVIADGVNDLSLKRAEYSTVIKDNGYEYLVTNIEKKIAEMKNKKEK
ncbi:MAG: ABC transporter substrate-binding protein [Gammaproteobacteria bacterium]|nr:ABC transporter substrate-binding protein [Gammaproteobacteria bacterium]